MKRVPVPLPMPGDCLARAGKRLPPLHMACCLTELSTMKDQYSNMAVGIAVGVGLGAAIGAALDNIPIGIAIGIAIGVAGSAAFGSSR
jgi:hypothetical protein